jgi:hypothetical protein
VAGTARSMGIEVVDARSTGRGPCRDTTAAARSRCGGGGKPAGGAALRQATWSQPMEQQFLRVERPGGDNPQPEPGCAPQCARQDEEDAIVSNTSTSRAASIPATAAAAPTRPTCWTTTGRYKTKSGRSRTPTVGPPGPPARQLGAVGSRRRDSAGAPCPGHQLIRPLEVMHDAATGATGSVSRVSRDGGYQRDVGGDGWHDGLLMELLTGEERCTPPSGLGRR